MMEANKALEKQQQNLAQVTELYTLPLNPKLSAKQQREHHSELLQVTLGATSMVRNWTLRGIGLFYNRMKTTAEVYWNKGVEKTNPPGSIDEVAKVLEMRHTTVQRGVEMFKTYPDEKRFLEICELPGSVLLLSSIIPNPDRDKVLDKLLIRQRAGEFKRNSALRALQELIEKGDYGVEKKKEKDDKAPKLSKTPPVRELSKAVAKIAALIVAMENQEFDFASEELDMLRGVSKTLSTSAHRLDGMAKAKK